jgi:two-component system, OmpR family, response regulator QseB
VARALQEGLRAEGYEVSVAATGEEGFFLASSQPFDLIVLDVMLPGRDGLEVLAALRNLKVFTQVLLLTAKDAIEDRVAGLDAGADDYLVKPFDLDELAARIRALLRRRVGRADPIIQHRGIALNPSTQEVRFNGEPVALQPREFFLLLALLERPGAVLSREQLRGKLYRWGDDVESNTIDVHVHSLRKKISPDCIRTVRGVGYCTPAAL